MSIKLIIAFVACIAFTGIASATTLSVSASNGADTFYTGGSTHFTAPDAFSHSITFDTSGNTVDTHVSTDTTFADFCGTGKIATFDYDRDVSHGRIHTSLFSDDPFGGKHSAIYDEGVLVVDGAVVTL